jgi:hypothetical protein
VDQADRDRDQAAALQLPGEGDDTIANLDADGVGVHPQGPPQDVLADLLGDLVVAAEEHLEQVSPADDAHKGAGRVDHRQPLDLMVVEPPSRLGKAGVGPQGDGWGGHQFGRAVAGRLDPGRPPAAALQQPACRGLEVFLLEEQVGLGDDPDHPPVGVRTGTALMRQSANSCVISLNRVSSSTVTTSRVMTSRTRRRMATSQPPSARAPLRRPLAQGRIQGEAITRAASRSSTS